MKHITKRYIKKRLLGTGIFLWWITTVYILAAQIFTELRLDDALTGQFWSGIFDYRIDIDFSYGGNKKIWIYLPRILEVLSTPEVVTLDWGNTGLCYGKIRWIYYNNERGERLRPLDQNTLTGLQAIDLSYSGMQLSGGLFAHCTGLGGTPENVYGQITMTNQNTVYYLMGGTTYDFSWNMHGSALSPSLQRINNNLSGYIRDSYGGIGIVIGSTGCMDSRNPSPDTVCAWASLTQTSTCGNIQAATWTKNCTLWSAGFPKDNCIFHNTSRDLPWANTDGIDYSPSYYDRSCKGPESTLKHGSAWPWCSVYTPELNWAYEFARSFDITTIDQCSNVNMYGKLIRKDLAKMMVNFAENVFGRTWIIINDPRCELFNDISGESPQTKEYIKKSCRYGLMGLHSDGIVPKAQFDPYQEVTRAEFGTVLSRFIWKWDYNTEDAAFYYSKHLGNLKKVGIMTKIDVPFMKELRWWVMLTMQRIYDKVK